MFRYTAFFLALLISGQAFYNAGVLGYWVVNRAYIAATLCENRDRPELQCDGKCYLKKKLAAADTTPLHTEKLPPLKKGLDLAECGHLPAFAAMLLAAKPAGLLSAEPDRSEAGFLHQVFRPPAG